MVLYGRAIAQRIKGTLGITGWYRPRVHIDGGVWHLDVGSSHPGAEAGPKGMAVRHLKRYASWGLERRETVPVPIYRGRWKFEEDLLQFERTRVDEPLVFRLWRQSHCRVTMFGWDNRWKHLSGEAHLKINFKEPFVDYDVDRLGYWKHSDMCS